MPRFDTVVYVDFVAAGRTGGRAGETGNFARAAERLGITQPTLTRNIATLEARLGLRLFDRGRGGAVPTVFGQAVIDRGAAWFATPTRCWRNCMRWPALKQASSISRPGPMPRMTWSARPWRGW